jgi:hypothetical protein
MRTPSFFEASLLGFVAAALLPASAPAQGTSSATPVIGYYKFNVPTGSSLWVSGFVTKKDFQGQATSVAGGATSSITQTGANWTAGAFNLHYVEILDGPWAGLVLDVVGNSSSSVTVDGNLGAGGFNVAQNVRYCIRRHATLGTIFAGGAGLTAFEDSVKLFYDDGSGRSFYYDDTPPGQIVADDFTTPKNDEKVYPGQGMLITAGGPRQLTFGGNEVSYVKDSVTKVPLYGSKTNLVGRINPVVAATPLGTGLAAIESSPVGSAAMGLIDSGLVEYEDEILHFGLNGTQFTRLGIYYYDATQDTIVDGGGTPVTANIPHGSALVLKPSGDRYYTQPAVPVN